MGSLFKFWMFILAAAFGAYMMVYNRESVVLTFPGIGEYNMFVALALIVSFVVGATCMFVYQITETLKVKMQLRSLKKQVQSLEHELNNQKNPIGYSEE